MYTTIDTGCNPKDIQTVNNTVTFWYSTDWWSISPILLRHPRIPKPPFRFHTFPSSFPGCFYITFSSFTFLIAIPFNSLFLPLLCPSMQLSCQPSIKQHSVAGSEWWAFSAISKYLVTDIEGKSKKSLSSGHSLFLRSPRKGTPIWVSLYFHKIHAHLELLRPLPNPSNQSTSSKS